MRRRSVPQRALAVVVAGTLGFAELAGAAAEARAASGTGSVTGGPTGMESGDALSELLASGALEQSSHPVGAEFLLAEGATRLSDAERSLAMEQLKRALGRQTSSIGLLMEGATAMMTSDLMVQMQQSAQQLMGPGGMAKMMLGVGPATPQVDGSQMAAEMEQAMVDPWVRGIGAAEALVAAGEPDEAASFYLGCLQMLQADWVPAACLDGILRLGPEKAETLLVRMVENAENESMTNMANWGQPPPKKAKNEPPDQGTTQLRNAALEGLGALAGAGVLSPASRENAMRSILKYASGKESEIYAQGAAAGLGRSRDPRALEPLRKLAKRRGDPDAKQTALHGLAVGFRDEAAIRQLRGELDDRDPDEQLRAAQALYELGDAAAFQWAVDVIGQRRSTDTKKPDIRAQVVRDLVELGGVPARKALEQALAEGPGNDWLIAWVEVGLLEIGDLSQVAKVEAAMAKEDWKLDPRGFRSIWRAISPFLQAALSVALTGGLGLASPSTYQQVKQAVSLIGNFAAGERSRSLAKKNRLEARIAQLRWSAADALGASNAERAGELLERLLEDDDRAVRLSATLALARLDRPEALSGLAKAFPLDFGAEGGVDRTGAVRAALLRAALARFPGLPQTMAMLQAGRADADPAVRFIALAGARPARG